MSYTELRQYVRVRPESTFAVVLARHSHSGTFAVENLSVGGALLVGELALVDGEVIKLLLELGGNPIVVSGQVVRVAKPSGDRRRVAVAFREVSPSSQGRIQASVVNTLQRQRAASPPLVLVFAERVDVRKALERDLAALGVHSLAAATSLEGVRQLEDVSLRFETVIVDAELDPEVDVVSYVIRAHPQIRRILLSDQELVRARETASGRVHAGLGARWSEAELVGVLGRD